MSLLLKELFRMQTKAWPLVGMSLGIILPWQNVQ